MELKKHSDALGALVAVVLFFAAVLALVALTGCSHNTLSYGDGIMLETTANPETFAFGVSLRYGKILTVCARENTEVEMQGGTKTPTAASGEPTASTEGSVRMKVGRQCTGYLVDAIEAGAKAKDLAAYTADK